MRKGPAGNYAIAALTIAKDDIVSFEAEVHEFYALFQKDEQLRVFYESPRFSRGEKKKLLLSSLSGKVSKALLNLLLILVDKKRERMLGDVVASIESEVDKRQGRVRAQLLASVDLSEDEKQSIISHAVETVKKHRKEFGVPDGDIEVSIQFIVKPEIQGGVILKVGDYLLDSSVRTYLRKWRDRVYSRKIDINQGWSNA